jgi:hypothetical protein
MRPGESDRRRPFSLPAGSFYIPLITRRFWLLKGDRCGGLDQIPELGVSFQGFVFAQRQSRPIKEIFQRIATQDAVHHDPQLMPLKVNSVVAQTEAMQTFARPFQFAKSFQIRAHDLVGQTSKLAEDKQLQLLGHSGQFTGAGRIENNLKRTHGKQLGRWLPQVTLVWIEFD